MEIGVKIRCDDIHIPILRRLLKEKVIIVDDYWLVITNRPERAKDIIKKYFEGIENENRE